MSDKLKVVFLGSGPIAIPVMRALAVSSEIELTAVISQPDRPAGRKRVLTPTPLAQAAIDLGLDAVRTADVNAPEFTEYLREMKPDFLCVVSFGQILKSAVLAVPEICCVNVHASLLPCYRGASPIVQAIINGDKRAGVCFMQMERGLDSGPVFQTLTMELDGSEYADSLETELGELAAEHTVETLQKIADGTCAPVPQDPAGVTVCRKIAKRDGFVSWNSSAPVIEAMSRAYFPWPGAVTQCRIAGGKIQNITICSAKVSDIPAPATALCADIPGRIIVGCGDSTSLEILELIPSGGKRMSAASFRNGLRGALPEFITELEI